MIMAITLLLLLAQSLASLVESVNRRRKTPHNALILVSSVRVV